MALDYERDGAAIYRASFATIRREADLGRVPARLERVAVRMVHACGMPDLVDDLAWSADFAAAARGGPGRGRAGAVRRGHGRRRDHPVPPAGRQRGGLHARRPPGAGAGGRGWAPPARPPRWSCGATGSTARWWPSATPPRRCSTCWSWWPAAPPRPAAVVGVPVGFVGAAESKAALASSPLRLPFLVVNGRRGGSALASAAVNALASDRE